MRVALFVLALFTPLGAMGLNLGHGPDVSESRHLADWPKLVLRPRELALYPLMLRYYFGDHFGFRDSLIHLHGLICLKILGVVPNPDVTLGKDGWFFLAGDGSTDAYRHTKLFSDVELQRWRNELERRQAWVAARGGVYVFVVAPDKETIYGEYMPDLLTQVTPQSRLDQLVTYMKQRSGVPVVDIRAPLIAAKEEERVYHKTDTHWNERGAFIAYQAIMQTVRTLVPRAVVLSATQFERTENETEGMDLTRQLGIKDAFRERQLDLTSTKPMVISHVEQDDRRPIVVRERGSGLPSVVVFRDSFLTSVIPFLAESFGKGLYLWQDDMDFSLLAASPPDVVIQEIAERKLMRIDPSALPSER